MMPGRKKIKRKPLSELYFNGKFTENIEECQKGLQRHCEGLCINQDEAREVQEKIIEYFKNKKEDWHFTDDGRGAEITIDLVLQARAKMSENKVNGPEDAVVSDPLFPLQKDKQKKHQGHAEQPGKYGYVCVCPFCMK